MWTQCDLLGPPNPDTDAEPVIALWTGHAAQGYGFGTISFLNSSYDEIYQVTLGCKEQKFVTVFEPMESLKGRTSDEFHLGLDTSFYYQHDVRFESQTPERVTLGVHNNYNTNFTGATALTTGPILGALQGSKQVTLSGRMWDADEPVCAQSQGSYQVIGNGHVLQDHGATPKIEEYDKNGRIVMRARFGYDNTMQTNRAYRYPWAGRPSTEPSVVAYPSSKSWKTTV
ncbi:hypothetical protein PMG11_07105 [Penicillium brasilianum]|uniref:Uncharacterized protein n=1 Tax=Penicillium brasilianum TaxID=104259 RepID=A0A0F7TRP0_PENBI|nr:hypothetical protein PMG11_07105 [Penicillium brasilianum]